MDKGKKKRAGEWNPPPPFLRLPRYYAVAVDRMVVTVAPAPVVTAVTVMM